MLEVAEAFARQSDRENTRAALSEALGAAQWIKEGWRKSEAEMRLAMVDSLHAGKIVRIRFYLDPAEALQAVGLEE